jgi:hypothetical protein
MTVTNSAEPRVIDGVEIHVADNEWAMGELPPCLIVVWRGAVTEERTLKINERIWAMTQRYSEKCAYINVIERNSPPPSPAVRKLAMQGMNRPGKALGCMVAAIEGNELRSAFVRAILTGMALLRPQQQPTKFFKNTAELARWVTSHLASRGADIAETEIVRAAEVIRSQITS